MGQLQEEVNVIAEAPLIDIKASSTAETTLDKKFLESIPTAQSTGSIVQLAPGVTPTGSAYGGDENTGVSVHVDGISTQNPVYGTSGAVTVDYGIVEEANVTGIGAPAEYDGIEGITVNLITKSGGNNFSAHGQFIYQGKSWNSREVSVKTLAPPVTTFQDYNGYLGGPFIKDRLWFFVSGRQSAQDQELTGFDDPMTARSLRAMFKLTGQVTDSTRVQAFAERETTEIKNYSGGPLTPPEAVWTVKLPFWVWNASLFQVFSSSSYLEAKYSGYDGGQDLIPASGSNVAGHLDLATGMASQNAVGTGVHKTKTHHVLIALSHFQDNFIKGSHDIKLGAQYSHNDSVDAFYYNGENYEYYLDMMGQPYLLQQWQGQWGEFNNRQLSFYLQDTWSVSDRLTINPGLRYNIFRGKYAKGDEWIYKTTGLAPRLGFTFDIFGDKKTILKGHYGWFYPGMNATYYFTLGQMVYDTVTKAYMGPSLGYVEIARVNTGKDASMDSDVKHPRQEEFTLAVERELVKDLSLSLAYINRTGKNFIQSVNIGGTFIEQQILDPYTNEPLTVYFQTNPGQDKYIYTNPSTDGPYENVLINPKRKYDSVALSLNKRFSNKWMMLASYVYSKATYTEDNVWGGSRGMIEYYQDPNNQINIEGRPKNDPTHIFKLQGTVILPLDIALGTNLTYVSGTTYTRRLSVLMPQGLRYIFTEERGSRRLDPYIIWDVRLEKQFNIRDNFMVGIYGDVFNILNRSVVTGINNTAGPSFEQATALSSPRGARLGVRFFFN